MMMVISWLNSVRRLFKRRSRPVVSKKLFDHETVMENLPAAIFITDTAGRITYYNLACVELCGDVPVLGDVTLSHSSRLYTEDGRLLTRAEWPITKVLETGVAIRNVPLVGERADGSRMNILSSPTPLFQEGKMAGVVNMFIDVTTEKAHEERLKAMSYEVNHRANNLITVVRSVVTLTQAGSVDDLKNILAGRIDALSRANKLMADSGWKHIELRKLIEQETGTDFKSVTLVGNPLEISSRASQTFVMMLHELYSNARRHGSLTVPTGTLVIEWRVVKDRFHFIWMEVGGPKAVEPPKPGVGMRIISSSVRNFSGETDISWAEDGLVFYLDMPMESLQV